jgi:hypothetical protein
MIYVPLSPFQNLLGGLVVEGQKIYEGKIKI